MTERLRDRCNHADFTAAIRKHPAFCHFTAVVWIKLTNRVMIVDQRENLLCRHHIVHAPAVGGTDVHVLDKAQNNSGVAEAANQGNDFMFILPSLDDHIDLDRRKTDALRRFDTVEYRRHRCGRIAHALKDGITQAVEADGKARQASILQRLNLSREQQSVGRQGYFDGLALRRTQLRQRLDQVLDTVTHQRLAAGQADLLYTQLHKHAGDSFDLLEAEQFGARQEDEILAKDLTRHAVGAAQITAVGD